MTPFPGPRCTRARRGGQVAGRHRLGEMHVVRRELPTLSDVGEDLEHGLMKLARQLYTDEAKAGRRNAFRDHVRAARQPRTEESTMSGKRGLTNAGTGIMAENIALGRVQTSIEMTRDAPLRRPASSDWQLPAWLPWV